MSYNWQIQKKLNELINDNFISENNKANLWNFIQFHISQCKGRETVTNNLMIVGDDEKKTEELATSVINIINESPNNYEHEKSIEYLNVDNYLREGLPIEFDSRYVIITGIEDFDDPRWDDLIDIMKNNKKSVLIMLLKNELYQSLKEFNQHLFYRVFNEHVYIDGLKIDDVYNTLISKLEIVGYRCSNKFTIEIKNYIDVVYPKADLKDNEFIEDLYNRIIRLVAEKNHTTEVLNDSFVPYYVKPEAKSYIEPDIDNCINADKLLGEIRDLPKDSSSLKANRNQNILLVALSTFPRNMSVSKYIVNGQEESYPYLYQLEPIPQVLARSLAKNGETLDRIIMLCTHETSKDCPASYKKNFLNSSDEPEEMSPVRYFEYRTAPCMKFSDIQDDMRFIPISIMANDPSQGVHDAVAKIREFNKAKKVNLFIDEHGGDRSTQIVLESVTSLLKNEINICDVYTVRSKDSKNSLFEVIKNVPSLQMFDFVSGINEFINYGKIDSLKAYYKDSQDGNIKEMLVAMEKIASGLQLCDTVTYLQGLDDFTAWYEKCNSYSSEDNAIEITDTTDENGNEDNIIKIFKETIKEEYGPLLTQERTVLDTVRWCAQKGFIQQALTFIEDRIPDYYIEKNILKFETDITYDVYKNFIKEKHKTASWNWYSSKNNMLFYGSFNDYDLKNDYVEKFWDNILTDSSYLSSNLISDNFDLLSKFNDICVPRKLKWDDFITFCISENSFPNTHLITNTNDIIDQYIKKPSLYKNYTENIYNKIEDISVYDIYKENCSKIFKLLMIVWKENLGYSLCDGENNYKNSPYNQTEYRNAKNLYDKFKNNSNCQYVDIDKKILIKTIISNSSFEWLAQMILDYYCDKKNKTNKISTIKEEFEYCTKKLEDKIFYLNESYEKYINQSYNNIEEGISIKELLGKYVNYRVAEADYEYKISQGKYITIDDDENKIIPKYINSDYFILKKFSDLNVNDVNIDFALEYGISNNTWVDMFAKAENGIYTVYLGKSHDDNIKNAEFSIPNPDNVNKLDMILQLHNALKQERNNANHGSSKGERVSAEIVKTIILIYIDLIEQLN